MPLAFDASASSDPDGTIATYAWAFGDGQAPAAARAEPRLRAPGTYRATLTLTDNEGCSTALVFTGQTAYCNGSSIASMTRSVKVAYPGVRVKCPKSARPKGCKFKLRVVTKSARERRRAPWPRPRSRPDNQRSSR